MRLETLGPNQTLVHIGGQEYFFSYNTCVAGRDDDNKFWKVDHQYSNTTSRHINKYLDGVTPEMVTVSDVQLAMDCL